MYKEITEGKATVKVPIVKKISKDMEVFYNPVMVVNRDFSTLVLKAYGKNNLKISLPLAGSGIRAARLLKELPEEQIKELYINDYDEQAVKLIKQNIGKTKHTVHITNTDASIAMLQHPLADYIDVDPFGSPNPFLDAAIKRTVPRGILAVTATDTAALTGTYLKAARRKYWGTPIRNYLMHEIGIRMLIHKIQLQAAQYEKTFVPLVAYTHEHYYKIFFLCAKGKSRVDKQLEQSSYLDYDEKSAEFSLNQKGTYGPIYTGYLQDKTFLKKMLKYCDDSISPKTTKLVQTLIKEADFPQVGFYQPAGMARHLKSKDWKRFEKIKELLDKKGYGFAPTHMQKAAFRTDAPQQELKKIVFG